MSAAWRCFVAVPLDEGLRTALADAIVGWRADPRVEQLRWVERAAMHLTLAFLGSVEPERVDEIKGDVARVAERHAAMTRPTSRLGAFARPGSAHVLWYAVADPDGGLAAIAGDLARALWLPSPDPFRPHVTLARARRRPVDLRGWIEEASAAVPEGILAVRDLHLMRSHLGGGPARYETLASVPLGGQPQ
jgi:RNA 2',3'-cyclic 3'-phosphodiesterase